MEAKVFFPQCITINFELLINGSSGSVIVFPCKIPFKHFGDTTHESSSPIANVHCNCISSFPLLHSLVISCLWMHVQPSME